MQMEKEVQTELKKLKASKDGDVECTPSWYQFSQCVLFFIKLEITVLPSEPFMENCLRFEKLYSRHKRNGPSDSVFIVLYIFILLHLPVHMHE